MITKRLVAVAFAMIVTATAVCARVAAEREFLDFTSAQLEDVSEQSETELAAIQLLREEVADRTGITWPDVQGPGAPRIVLGTRNSLLKTTAYARYLSASHLAPDGFQIKWLPGTDTTPVLLIAGNSPRGLVFGVGYFLRKVRLMPRRITVPRTIETVTEPVVALRGHQLGYRPKVNSYDGFTVPMWERYIRDLAVFGTNAVELMPPFTDDDADSPLFPLPQSEMLVAMSALLKKYGMDVWMWYPLMHGDYRKPEVVKKSLEENEELFKNMPRLDAVFVPGGDPGRQKPEVLFEHLERVAKVLHRYHPGAGIWISPQGYTAAWMEQFEQLLRQKPAWLTGVTHGPWVRMDVNDLRKIVPSEYPIRRYPDITHSIDAQYFVPDWDYAYTVTENRETINPRPMDQAAIFHSVALENHHGFITYSEGVNDDVNKMIWSGLGWDPQADVVTILRDYARYFIDPELTDAFAQGLLNLEQNWRGALLNNRLVDVHHAIFKSMENRANPRVRLNWRFQMALYRSYYDAYTRDRLLYETQLEKEAMAVLRQAQAVGAGVAMNKAEAILSRASLERQATDLRQRLFELAEGLFQSTRMQLSVSKYFAIDTIRGANLDLADYPLNNRYWLEDQFASVRALSSEEERLRALDAMVNWTNPGLGGFYDDLGDAGNQPHLVTNHNYKEDPNSFQSAFAGLPGGYSLEIGRIRNWRVSWKTYAQTIYDLPLEMRYEHLDPDAAYQVKVTYIEDQKIRLTAGDGITVHDYLLPAEKPVPVVYDIPVQATKTGTLSLKWNMLPGSDGPGRGCSVAEVWLMKKPADR